MENGDKHKYNYHYKREERLSMPNAPKKDTNYSKNIFKRNKSLVIILIDIIIILVVFSFYKIFIEMPSYVGKNNGYVLTLSGFSTSDQVIVRIKIRKVEQDAAAGNAEITFKAGNNTLEIISELPVKTGEVIEVTDNIGVLEKTNELTAEIKINNKISELSLNLDDN